jgi:hypothetical protein
MAAITETGAPRPHTSRPVAAAALLLALCSGAAMAAAPARIAGRQLENLDRGVVAIAASGGVFVSWRALASDAGATRFNLYRDGMRVNADALNTTSYTDAAGTAASVYTVRAFQGGGAEQAPSSAGATWSQPYKTIPVQKPAGGVTPDGKSYTYEINDGSAADLDGDGSYELIIKWQPTNAHDNSQAGYTGNTYIDAYKMDGTRLWRVDLGRNIRAGAHYTTFLVYDFDGDGKAELMVKTADGTIDGKGAVIGDAGADYRNERGYVLSGPEFITVFNGETGAAMASAPYLPGRGDVAAWGDAYGNRVDRFLGGVAYLDGERPSAIFSRGYYTRAVIAAWDWRGGKLSSRWVFDSDVAGGEVNHQGAHWLSVADVNNDGKDDIIYGAATINSDGKMLYSTGLCHGDALHVGKLDPRRPGLQIFMVHETPSCYGKHGIEMHDAATGKILWSLDGQGADVGRGVCMDIDPAHLGEECWASVGGLMSASGEQISAQHPRRINFASWWDGDLLRESLDGTRIEKWSPKSAAFEPLLNGADFGAASNNGTKATPVLSADLLGDWREEVVWRSADNNALLLFSTTAPTVHRIPALMQDAQYRVQVAGQNAGYNQPPHPSFYVGEGMAQPQGVARPVQTHMEELKQAEARPADLQGLGTKRSFAGDYSGAIAAFDERARGVQAGSDNPADIEKLSDATAEDAIAAIVAEARGKRIVFLNEAHHVPMHRAFAKRLAAELRKIGYTYLACEAFSTDIAQRPKGGVLTNGDGYYLRDPMFVDFVHSALADDWKLVGYEAADMGLHLSQKERIAQRERVQAANLVERVFAKDKDAKVFVYVGYSHLLKGDTGGFVMMGEHLRRMTGLDTLHVEQERFYAHPDPAFNGKTYQAIIEKFKPAAPIVLKSGDGRPLVLKGMAQRSDMQVVFPPYATGAGYGRPVWLEQLAQRKPQPIPPSLLPASGRRLILAHRADDPAGAMPVDTVLVEAGKAVPQLMLPSGAFRFSAQD